MKSKCPPLVMLGIILMLAAMVGRCAEASAPSEAELLKELNSRLHFQTGEVKLPGNLAKLSLSQDFHYLSPSDAEFVLTKLWGNPPGSKTLGMIFPSGMSPAGKDTWGIVITYSDDGYIKDSDADSI